MTIVLEIIPNLTQLLTQNISRIITKPLTVVDCD